MSEVEIITDAGARRPRLLEAVLLYRVTADDNCTV